MPKLTRILGAPRQVLDSEFGLNHRRERFALREGRIQLGELAVVGVEQKDRVVRTADGERACFVRVVAKRCEGARVSAAEGGDRRIDERVEELWDEYDRECGRGGRSRRGWPQRASL